jgi:hypothetical protein
MAAPSVILGQGGRRYIQNVQHLICLAAFLHLLLKNIYTGKTICELNDSPDTAFSVFERNVRISSKSGQKTHNTVLKRVLFGWAREEYREGRASYRPPLPLPDEPPSPAPQ